MLIAQISHQLEAFFLCTSKWLFYICLKSNVKHHQSEKYWVSYCLNLFNTTLDTFVFTLASWFCCCSVPVALLKMWSWCDQIVAKVIEGLSRAKTTQTPWNQRCDFHNTQSFVTQTDTACKTNVSELQVQWKSHNSTMMYII